MPERKANGQFAKGNGLSKKHKPGPGRPKKKREEKYYQITQTACTFADWERIMNKAVSQALRGDKDARKFLAGYLIGPPPKELRITGADGGPMILEYVNDWRKDGKI